MKSNHALRYPPGIKRTVIPRVKRGLNFEVDLGLGLGLGLDLGLDLGLHLPLMWLA